MSKQQFPIYIPSKGRHESRMTMKALDLMGMDYYVIVEDQQYNDYASVIDKRKLLVLDMDYKRTYETCDHLGDEKSKGAGPARNFAWDHAISINSGWHWIMDDNIRSFRIFNKNEKIKCETPDYWRAMEDFTLRFSNVGMSGPNYTFFAPSRQKKHPMIVNTRIYSCNFIRNDLKFRWRGRYNEDTILSLDVLKDNWCTILFNQFLQEKMVTQALKGGNTAEFYAKEGTANKSKMIVQVHPDVARLAYRYGRAHHHVDYNVFKKNAFKVRTDISSVKKPVYKFNLIEKHHDTDASDL